MKKKLVCILICLYLVLLTAVNVNAQLPGIINFQAKIADNNGIPLNGLHTFNFLIIDQNSNILWDAYNIQIMIENGLYSVKLGDASIGMDPIPSSIFDENDETYLRIFVDGEQLSDQQILPTCYAFKSEKSDDTHKIAGNPVSGTSPYNNQVLKWNGSQWEPGNDNTGGGFINTYQVSIGETNWFGNSYVDVVSVTVSVSTGQKVLIIFSCECSSSPGQGAIELEISNGTVVNRTVYCEVNGESYPAANQCLVTPGSGTFTYTLRAKNLVSGYSGKVRRANLIAIVG